MSAMTQDFPFTKPEGSDAEMFIQWKGTAVCLDFRCTCGYDGHCTCGYDGHVDSGYAYFIECGGCGAVFEMGTQVIARRVEDSNGRSTVVTVA